MATVTTQYIWPPNWSGEEANLRKIVVQFTGIFDASDTAETNVRKIDVSAFNTIDGVRAGRMSIEKIDYHVQGLNHVTLSFDRHPAIIVARLPQGQGCVDFCKTGGLCDVGEADDGTGDLLLSTDHIASTEGAYTIKVTAKLKEPK